MRVLLLIFGSVISSYSIEINRQDDSAFELVPPPLPQFQEPLIPFGPPLEGTLQDISTSQSEQVKLLTVEKRVEVPVHKFYPAPFPVERKVPFPVEILKPYPVIQHVPMKVVVTKKIPYPVKVPVPRPVPVIKPVPVPVEKLVPVPVERKVPYPVKVYVPVPMKQHDNDEDTKHEKKKLKNNRYEAKRPKKGNYPSESHIYEQQYKPHDSRPPPPDHYNNKPQNNYYDNKQPPSYHNKKPHDFYDTKPQHSSYETKPPHDFYDSQYEPPTRSKQHNRPKPQKRPDFYETRPEETKTYETRPKKYNKQKPNMKLRPQESSFTEEHFENGDDTEIITTEHHHYYDDNGYIGSRTGEQKVTRSRDNLRSNPYGDDEYLAVHASYKTTDN